MARLIGQKLSESLGQPVIIENKPGGGAIVATEYVVKSAPDGYTFGFQSFPFITNPSLFAKLPYDPIKGFVPVGMIATVPTVLVVNPSFPAKTLKEFIDYCKANPGKITYSSGGPATISMSSVVSSTAGEPGTRSMTKNGVPMIAASSHRPWMRGTGKPVAPSVRRSRWRVRWSRPAPRRLRR